MTGLDRRRLQAWLCSPAGQHSLWAVVPIMVAFGLGFAQVAEARLGGGQLFRSGSRVTYSGGGSGGDGSGLAELLIYLVIRYPAVGIPLLIIAIGIYISQRHTRQTHPQTRRYGKRTAATDGARPAARNNHGLDALRSADPGFSVPVLQEFLVMLFQRVDGAVNRGSWRGLEPFVSAAARNAITKAYDGVATVDETVVGTVKIERVRSGRMTLLDVIFAATRRVDQGRAPERFYVEERWTLQRSIHAVSLGPEEMLRMGCPSCGSAAETDALGACRNCGTAISKGQLQWQLIRRVVLTMEPVNAPNVSFFAGGDEPSFMLRTIIDPSLPAELRKLRARHRDVSLESIQARATKTFMSVQASWSAGRYEDIRPYVTDSMFQSLRFWVEKYERAGLRNRLDEVSVLNTALVKVDVDAWFQSVTLRIWGSMKDSTIDASGTVVGGNAAVARRFSEYWTFLRAVGSAGPKHSEGTCPSCGAPLDAIGRTGICGYCDTKITNGSFDWVLSRIDQPEAYAG